MHSFSSLSDYIVLLSQHEKTRKKTQPNSVSLNPSSKTTQKYAGYCMNMLDLVHTQAVSLPSPLSSCCSLGNNTCPLSPRMIHYANHVTHLSASSNGLSPILTQLGMLRPEASQRGEDYFERRHHSTKPNSLHIGGGPKLVLPV